MRTAGIFEAEQNLSELIAGEEVLRTGAELAMRDAALRMAATKAGVACLQV